MTIAPLTAFHRRLAIADGCVVLSFDIHQAGSVIANLDVILPIGAIDPLRASARTRN